MPKKIKFKNSFGDDYTQVRKVAWDESWHLCWGEHGEIEGWDRVDKKTALKIATKI